ncbi:MAG: MFS transporter [Eubacteriales bacterium]
MMGIGSKRKVLLVSFLILLIVTMLFTGGLNIYSFSQNYAASIVKNYALIGQEAVRKMEYALKYGKDIGNYYGMKDILNEITYYTKGNGEAGIVLPDGELRYGLTEGNLVEENWSSYLEQGIQNVGEGEQSYFSLLEKGSHFIFMPVKDGEETVVGYLTIVFSDDMVWSKTQGYISRLMVYLGLLVLLAGLVFAALLWRGKLLSKEEKINRKLLLKSVFILLGIIQIAYGFLNYQIFRDGYLDLAEENVSAISGILEKNIESVVEKGVPYEKLYGLEKYLQTMDDSMLEINGIALENERGKALYETMGFNEEIDKNQSDMAYRVNLLEDRYTNKAVLWVGLSAEYIADKTKNIVFDMLSLLVVSIFFLVEITFFGFVFMEEKINKSKNEKIGKVLDVGRIRPLAFVVFAASSMSIAFIPLAMKKLLFQPLWGLPEGVALGLPISAEMLCALIATVYAGKKVDERGWKPIFLVGMVILAIGNVISSLVSSGIFFIAARGITGIGFGLILMAMRAFIIVFPTVEERTKGIAGMNSGALAGISCGAVTGAMFADRLGFGPVFFIAGILAFLGLLFAMSYLPNAMAKHAPRKKEMKTKNPGKAVFPGWLNFLLDRKVITYLLLVLVPISVVSMYLSYYLPLFAESEGISVGHIGRIIMLNGICIIYAGPFLSRYVVQRLGDRKGTGLLLFATAGALFVFAFLNNLAGMLASVVILGVAESFGTASHTNYYLGLEKTVDYGEGKALGIYSIVNKFGQMLAPLIFGILGSVSLARGAGTVGLVIIIFAFIFVLFSKEKNRQVKHINESGINEGKGN